MCSYFRGVRAQHLDGIWPEMPQGPQKAPRNCFTAIPGGQERREGYQKRFYSHSKGGGVPRRLPGTVLQPFQGGTRGPESSQERFYRHSRGWGPQKVPRSGFATILYSHSRGHSRRVGAPRRLPGHPEGSQERFCSHSKVVGAPEGPWRRDGGGGFALLTTPYEGFVPFNQPLQGFWACRWPAPRRSGFNQPLRGG